MSWPGYAADVSDPSHEPGPAEAAPAEPGPAEPGPAEPPAHDRFDHESVDAAGRAQQWFERMLAGSRLLVLIPVVFLLVDAIGSFVYGSDILVRSLSHDVAEPARVGGRLGIFLVVMDTFLVGATLMVAAFGFYELFVLKRELDEHKYWLPNWLRMRDLEDLKARVVSMLILVAAITFVDIAVEAHDERGVLFLGLGIAVVIVALTAFLRFGRRVDR